MKNIKIMNIAPAIAIYNPTLFPRLFIADIITVNIMKKVASRFLVNIIFPIFVRISLLNNGCNTKIRKMIGKMKELILAFSDIPPIINTKLNKTGKIQTKYINVNILNPKNGGIALRILNSE